MTPDDRKTKAVAKRIDLTYHKQPSPLRSLRRALVVACAVLALAWGGWSLFANSERLYNPGPVAPAHAMFENNCSTCHDGGGGKHGFLNKTVSDHACLQCHDAAIHADKQPTTGENNFVSLENNKPARSSNCITCHVEHKGHAALAGTSDLLCTRCHDNLTSNVKDGATALQTSINSFNAPPAHPPFGRVLKSNTGQLTDPTRLKFNHKKHFSEITPAVGDCSTCHRVSQSAGAGRIMQPVNYDANCKECHPMWLVPGQVEVPHQSLSLVRLLAANPQAAFAQRLAALTPDAKEAALTVTTKVKQGLRTVEKKEKITEAQWLEQQAKSISDTIAGSTIDKQPSFKLLENLDPTTKAAATNELYIATTMKNSCNYCHDVTGVPQSVAKAPAEILKTLPTGFTYTAQPPTTAPTPTTTHPLPTPEGRRWFTASIFDHTAHRSMACTECHAQAKSSTLTSDVLLPDAQSCARCHHPGGTKSLAASNNCTTCHQYHDRFRETQPVKSLSASQLLGAVKPKS